MSTKTVMVIEKPYMIVRLHERLLEVDFVEGVRKELEDALEARPALRETLGFLFQTVIPLDVPLKDVESVGVDEDGNVKVMIPFRRDITIPLKGTEARRLIDRMNELIPKEKARALRELQMSEKRRRTLEPRRAEAQREAYRGTVR